MVSGVSLVRSWCVPRAGLRRVSGGCGGFFEWFSTVARQTLHRPWPVPGRGVLARDVFPAPLGVDDEAIGVCIRRGERGGRGGGGCAGQGPGRVSGGAAGRVPGCGDGGAVGGAGRVRGRGCGGAPGRRHRLALTLRRPGPGPGGVRARTLRPVPLRRAPCAPAPLCSVSRAPHPASRMPGSPRALCPVPCGVRPASAVTGAGCVGRARADGCAALEARTTPGAPGRERCDQPGYRDGAARDRGQGLWPGRSTGPLPRDDGSRVPAPGAARPEDATASGGTGLTPPAYGEPVLAGRPRRPWRLPRPGLRHDRASGRAGGRRQPPAQAAGSGSAKGAGAGRRDKGAVRAGAGRRSRGAR